jgi:putative Mg2+ transporter-C (MgtC) family protein
MLRADGKPHDSYAVMDLMRLPLGILTGVGFIGAGAIVRKDEMVLGIMTGEGPANVSIFVRPRLLLES